MFWVVRNTWGSRVRWQEGSGVSGCRTQTEGQQGRASCGSKAAVSRSLVSLETRAVMMGGEARTAGGPASAQCCLLPCALDPKWEVGGLQSSGAT